MEALSGAEALAFVDREEAIDLVLTDVVTPGTTGTALASEIGTRLPN